jgi:signal peptidase II
VRDVQAARDAPLTDPAGGGDDGAPRRGNQRLLLLLTALAVVVADLATKTWIVHAYRDGRVSVVVPHVLDVEQSRNAGAAFGIATGLTVVLSLVAVAVAVVIVRESRRLRSRWWAVALGLLLGGAVGNLGDRIFRSPGILRGRVVDWIAVTHYPVFNLADSGITIGGILAVVLATRGLRLDGSREQR